MIWGIAFRFVNKNYIWGVIKNIIQYWKLVGYIFYYITSIGEEWRLTNAINSYDSPKSKQNNLTLHILKYTYKQETNYHIFQEHVDGQDEVIFSHKWEIQQPKKSLVKNSEFKNNSRTSLKKWLFFKYISSTKKIPEQFKEFKEFQNRWPPCKR